MLIVLRIHPFDEGLPCIYVSLNQRKQLFLLPELVLQSCLLLVIELQLNDSLVLHIIKIFQRILEHRLTLLRLLRAYRQQISFVFFINMLHNNLLMVIEHHFGLVVVTVVFLKHPVVIVLQESLLPSHFIDIHRIHILKCFLIIVILNHVLNHLLLWISYHLLLKLKVLSLLSYVHVVRPSHLLKMLPVDRIQILAFAQKL